MNMTASAMRMAKTQAAELGHGQVRMVLSFMMFALLMLVSMSLMAGGGGSQLTSGLEGILGDIAGALTGPIAVALGIIACVLAGFTIAFGEAGGTAKKMGGIVLGLSIAFTAGTVLVPALGGGSLI